MLKVSDNLKKYASSRAARPKSSLFLYLVTIAAALFGIWMLLNRILELRGTYIPSYQNLHCKTCALVSNSGHIIGSTAGKKIDENDCVFRINNAPTKNFEEIVGTKTTVRVVASDILDIVLSGGQIEDPISNPVVIYPLGNRAFLREVQAGMNNPSAIHVLDEDSLIRFNASFHSAVFAAAEGRMDVTPHPSTGLISFLLALDKCETRLEVYGVVPPFHCHKYKNVYDAPRDYFPPGDKVSTCPAVLETSKRYSSAHFYLSETLAVQELSKTFPKVKFHEPTWP